MTRIISKGKKVILRPLSVKDTPRFCRWLADREVTKFLSFYEKNPPTIKEEKEWVRKNQKDKNNFILAIDTVEGRHIGTVGLHKIDYFNKNAEFGIMIGDKKYWGQGYGTETCKLIVDYSFKKLKLHRIYLRYIAYNVRGHKSYKKAGFKIEGRKREHVFRDGFWHDEIIMGLLASDFKKYGKKKNQ